MKQIETFCEPYWTGGDIDSYSSDGYWSIKIIFEYTPNFIEKMFGRKQYSTEHIYTNLNKYATAIDWRTAHGDELESFGVFYVAPGERLKAHLEKHIVAKQMEKIQKKVIKE